MLGLRRMGFVRLACPSSRRCGARLLAPFGPGWTRPGGLLLLPLPIRNVRLCAGKRGRPRKDQLAQTPPVPSQEDGESTEGEKPRKAVRRSRKEREKEEARDLLESQQIVMEVLEEFKARAAAEEEARKAAMGDVSEEDPRRLNFHRSLLAASQRGLTSECARIIESMVDAGLPPGPRAIHVWAYSYIQIGDGPGARRIADAGKEMYGISWIPETYVALMHGALSAAPGGPDLMAALQLWVAQQDAGAKPQLGFVFLAKELFRLKYSALAMQVVSEGYAAGLQPDEKLAALVIEQLCKQGLMDEARSQMQRLLDAGLLVGPEHYDTIVRLEAARGNLESAREMLQTYYTDPRFTPPRVSSYTALLKGLVSSLRQPSGVDGVLDGDVGDTGSSAGGRVQLTPEQLDQLLTALREEMVSRGLRPGREAYAAMVEAFAVVGDLDSALATYETMTRAKGTPALMRKKYLGRFVVSLLTSDRPIDALRLLRDCSTTPSYADARSCVTLPVAASVPLPSLESGGRSALTAWLPGHFEIMRQRKGQRASMMSFMREADMMSRREVDGVVLGMGGCVVTEEGLWVPPSKMTLLEMRVELTAGGMDASVASGAARKELQKMIKDRRERLPGNLLEMQMQLEATVVAQEEEEKMAEEPEEEVEAAVEEFDDDEPEMDTLDVNIASIIADEGTFEGGDSLEDSATFRAAAGGRIMLTDDVVEAEEDAGEGDDEEDDDDVEEDEDMEEGFDDDMPAASGARKRRQRRRDDEDDDVVDVDDEDDELLGLEDSGVPPLGDGLGPTSSGPDDLDWEVERGREEGEDDAIILDQVLNMSVMDSSRYNNTAGMVVAMRMLELWVAVGCSPTPADLMVLYEGATIEEHPRSCADLAEQLPALLVAGEVTKEQLFEMLLTLANVCLRPGNADSEQADRVVTVMEDNQLQVPADVYSGLEAALNGRPRMRDSVLGVAGGRVEADLIGSGLESSVAVGDEEDDEAAVGEGVLAGVLGSGDGAAAEGEEATALEEVEEGEYEDEGEGDDLELYGEYEEDPAALEAEQMELQRLFQQDGEEDDAWLDELDEPTDVEEVRAAAEAEAAAVRQVEIITGTLESVRMRSPYAAALLEHQLATIEIAQGILEEAVAKGEDEFNALPAESREERASLVPYGIVDVEEGVDEVLDLEEEDEEDEEEVEGEGLDGLDAMAKEAEWDANALLELPPEVLAEAAAATEAEVEEMDGVEEEDRTLLQRIVAKTRVLAQLSAFNNLAAAAHPDGIEAADAEVSAAMRRIQKAIAEGAAATTILAAAAAEEGETAESLAEAAADEAAMDAFGEELEAADELEESFEDDDDDVLRPEHVDPGVDDGALDGDAAQLLRRVMADAEAILEAEEAEAEELKMADEEDDFDGLTVGKEEAAYDSAVLQRMLEAAERQGPELTEQQQEMFDMLERGDMSSLEAKVGSEVMAWLRMDLQRHAAEEEVEVQESPVEEPHEEQNEEGAPELGLGWRLNDRFMETFAAVLRERAAAAAERGITDDTPEMATVDALLAMAYGYRPQSIEPEQEEANEERVDEELEDTQQEAREALQRLAQEMGGPGEAAAREAAERALMEVLAVQTERYEDAEAAAEASPRVRVRPWEGPAEGSGDGRGEWDDENEEHEEGEEGGSGFELTEGVPPELAAAMLEQLRPAVRPVYVADAEEGYREAENEPGGSTTAVAEVEPEFGDWELEQLKEQQMQADQEQKEPPVRGKIRGRGGATGSRARKSSQ